MTFGTISNGAFVPACLHGYGVSYGIHPYRINFSCSAYKNCPTSSAKQYLNKVREFFREFHDIAVQVNEK